jgi:hypothetical protein
MGDTVNLLYFVLREANVNISTAMFQYRETFPTRGVPDGRIFLG